MSIAKVNSTSGRNTSSGTTANPTFGFTPTSGNVLVCWVGGSGSSAARTASATGWTKVGEFFQVNGVQGALGTLFIKISNGSETGIAITFTTTTVPAWVIEEWPGVAGGATDKIDTNFFPATPTPVATFLGYTTAGSSAAMNSLGLVMPTNDCLVLTGYGGRGSTSQPAPTWSGGAVASTAGATGGAGFCHSAAQEVTASSGSTITHVATGTDSQGAPAQVVGSVCFRVGASSSGTARKARVAGVWTAATRKSRVAGTWTTATRKSRVGGVWV